MLRMGMCVSPWGAAARGSVRAKSALVFGGAGLVGVQICRELAETVGCDRVIVGGLDSQGAQRAVDGLTAHAAAAGLETEYVPLAGNVFMPEALAHTPKDDVYGCAESRSLLLSWLYDDFERAYETSAFAQAILEHKPDYVVDTINAATGLAYLNVFDGVEKMRDWIGPETRTLSSDPLAAAEMEQLLLSQTMPQLIRHVRILERALRESGASYVKVGTSGTGGQGLNIPYTHDEQSPSPLLLAKNAAAFAHTGLLFLLARTPGIPPVKEVKPAAMIGYRSVSVDVAKDKHGNDTLFGPRAVDLGAIATLSLDAGRVAQDTVGDASAWTPEGKIELPLIDLGENGSFTLGEFEAITAVGSMEATTPEEIARVVVAEATGRQTGHDVIAAMDASVMDPSYRSGVLRNRAIKALRAAEADAALPSIALGKLGPPQLSKLLFEGALIQALYPTFEDAAAVDPSAMGSAISAGVSPDGPLAELATYASSIGIPILLDDGATLLRGPRLNIPQSHGHVAAVEVDGRVDEWADQGWVDLRASNMARWAKRLAAVSSQAAAGASDPLLAGSAAVTHHTYLASDFDVGEVVAWVLREEFEGHRIK